MKNVAPDNPSTSPKRKTDPPSGGNMKLFDNFASCGGIWYNTNMKHNRIVSSISIIGLAVLILMLTLTSPTEIGPLGVLLFFTTLYLTFFGVIISIMRLFYRLAYGREEFKRKDCLYAAVLAFGPIMLLMARSFSAINAWTICLIILLLSLAEFLVYKRT